MKELYTVTMFVMLVAMNVFSFRATKKKTPMGTAVVHLGAFVSITVFSSLMATMLYHEPTALVFQTIHYMSTEWVLIFLMRFMEWYSGRVEGNRFLHGLTFVFTAFSSIQLLLNAVFHHVVTCNYVYLGTVKYRRFVTLSPWYNIHEYFAYCLAVCCVLSILAASVQATSFYRSRYYPAGIGLLITLAMEVLCATRDVYLDYALFGYVGLCMFLTYHAIYHEDRGIIATTLSYIIKENDSGVICFDVKDKCIYANSKAGRIYPKVQDITEFREIFRKQIPGALCDAAEDKWDYEYVEGDEKKYCEVSFGKLTDKRNEYIGSYFYLYDKTQDVKQYRKQQYRASHDVLTDLYNREAFHEMVQKKQEESEDELYLIAADIKDFKLVNDLFGFELGNRLLKKFADKMCEALPEDAVCGRMNSDRFAFCVAKKDFSEEKIQEVISEVAGMVNHSEYRLHIHFGIYQIAKWDEDVSVMNDRARMALRLIKDDYQQNFAYYDDEMMDRLLREKNLLAEFDQALASHQFQMYLQPQVITSGETIGAEALVRWKHPEIGMISPGEFIHVFEDAGVIYRLDQYIWELAAKKLKEWEKEGKDEFHISVNISPKDTYYLDIYKEFTGLVQKYDINPEKLKLEITESAVMVDPAKQLLLLERLQRYGFHVEIDDFGSGYSSLNMLKDMKADVLKIDMGFLRETMEKERSMIILNIVVGLAKQLEMTVICEGVETKEQADFLTMLGCDMFQGYYFDKPIPVEEFEARYMN